MSRIPRLPAAFAIVLAAWATAPLAQTWPAKSLRVIVPVGAASTTDIVARAVVEQLAAQLGQAIVVENRAGAGTTIGENLVAKADSDGYTLLITSSAHTIAPALYSNLAYDPARDLAAVAPLGVSAGVLVVAPAKGYRTAAEFVAAAKAKPGAMNFSSVGIGTATHLSAERFRTSAGVAAVHVPFKGGAEAMTEVLAGRVDFFFGPVGLVAPHVREGKLVALAVNSARRSAALPDVPTTQEAGYANAEYPIWFGLFAPANTPRDIVEQLNRETLKALAAPKLRDRMLALGVDPMVMTASAFEAHVQREIAADAELVKATGIKLE